MACSPTFIVETKPLVPECFQLWVALVCWCSTLLNCV